MASSSRARRRYKLAFAKARGELQAYAKARLEPYKHAREVIFLDALPRTHFGKVDCGALAQERQYQVMASTSRYFSGRLSAWSSASV